VIREYFKQTSKYIPFKDLYYQLKTNEHYQALPKKISNQVLKLADQNYKNFFSLLRLKGQGKYNNEVKEPKFRKKGGLFNLVLDCQQISIIKNTLKITKQLRVPFTYEIKNVKQAIIKPFLNGKYFEIHITYEKENEVIKTEKTNILSIDMGVNNLATCYSNVGHDFIINGKPLKAYNQFYNKRKAKIQSSLETCNKKKISLKLEKLNINRKNWVDNYLSQSVSLILKEVKINNISKVVIGYNETWKQNINIGKTNNQTFTSIPHARFISKLRFKLEDIGVEVVFHEESYTSKCSSLDKEDVKKHETYLGKRIKRGLFKSSKGDCINADLNGAINIMRKVVPDEIVFSKGIERCIVHPKVLNLFNL
jgi:putative transposase